jgi:kynurenine formamidase
MDAASPTALRLELTLGGRRYHADPARAASIAIPIRFEGETLTAFGAGPAAARSVSGPGFVGDTTQGGSCNVGELHLIPHCHGTHTECVGHLVDERVSVDLVLRGTLFPATLVTLAPEPAAGHPEADAAIAAPGDRLVSARALAALLGREPGPFHRAVVIRTTPNAPTKLAARYDGAAPPPYLTAAAGALLAGLGCDHVIVDLPSLDRMADAGKLAAHRAFFGLPAGSRRLAEARRGHATITELAFVPDEIADGRYLVDLQLAPIASDAAPSRPLLIPLEEAGA